MRIKLGCLFLWMMAGTLGAQTLNLPPRSPTLVGGHDFAKFISILPAPPDHRREELIYAQFVIGNVPNWLRNLVLISTNAVINGKTHTISYYVTPDYLCIGSDHDYFMEPMTPVLAQRVANYLGCSLPTRKMVKEIWEKAPVKLTPMPLSPGDAMVTVPVFMQHNDLVSKQRMALESSFPLGTLTAGEKKDVVISALMVTNWHRSRWPVVIYGWQKTNGVPIQPIYNGHARWWADYSHGIRLVQRGVTVDGKPTTVAAVLTDTNLAALLSDETNFPGNVVPQPAYSTDPY